MSDPGEIGVNFCAFYMYVFPYPAVLLRQLLIAFEQLQILMQIKQNFSCICDVWEFTAKLDKFQLFRF